MADGNNMDQESKGLSKEICQEEEIRAIEALRKITGTSNEQSETTETSIENEFLSKNEYSDKNEIQAVPDQIPDKVEEMEEEEIKPKLKYERLANSVQIILQKDAISCVAFHSKIICIGTHWGVVYLLDHQGNMVYNEYLRAHTVAVNQISLDVKGDHIATCSDDGRVYVYGLYSPDEQELKTHRTVKSVAIDPYYYKGGGHKRFVTGDDRLMLHEKTFLTRMKSTVLWEGSGWVQNVKWYGRFLAFACDIGVRVYDIIGRVSLVLIKWSRSENVIPENFPCRLNWKNHVTLLIGWVDMVRVCKIEKRNSVIKDLPEFYVNSEYTFRVDFFVCGICPLDTTELAVLGYSKERDKDSQNAPRPKMYLLRLEESKYVEEYTDNLSLRGFADCCCQDYHLECLPDENRFIIACPKDVVIASLYDTDDKIDWLVSRNKFEEAATLALENAKSLMRNTHLSVGKQYVNHLLREKHYKEAGELCAKILGDDKERWEEEVFKFARVHQLRTVSKFLPTSQEQRLHPQIYEMVLFEYLKMDVPGFEKMVKLWPSCLYDAHAVINAVMEHIVVDPSNKPVLLECLAILYAHSQQYEKAINTYLKLKHKGVFQLITKHKLFPLVEGDIEKLVDLDPVAAVAMLSDKNSFEPPFVIKHLKHNERYLYLYLDMLDKKDREAAKKYHGQLVKLYAKFDAGKLLPFLKRSDSYPIHEALNVCRENPAFRVETMYLLGRIGKTKEALGIIVDEIKDIERAIEFCKEHNDGELWEELIGKSLKSADYISYLLENTGTYVDPIILISRIPKDMEIPRLTDSLVKMFRDYNLQMSVKEGCKNIVVSDCFNLHEKCVDLRRRGARVDDGTRCALCHEIMLMGQGFSAFRCRHFFHEKCLPPNGECGLCHSQYAPKRRGRV